jgi:hypothetical protein
MKKWFPISCVLVLVFMSGLIATPFPWGSFLGIEQDDYDRRERLFYAEDPLRKEEIFNAIHIMDHANTEYLKKILLSCELPVDEDDIDDVSPIILNSPDLTFQKSILELIQDNKNWRELIPKLTDRVLLRQGFPQRFGTHLHIEDGSFTPYPIEDLKKASVLRENFHELPLEVYIERTRGTVAAIARNDREYLEKYLFNIGHEFYGNPDDYLYYVVIPKKDWVRDPFILPFSQVDFNLPEDIQSQLDAFTIIAFDHPARAAIHALKRLGYYYEIKIDEDWDDELGMISYRVLPSKRDLGPDLFHNRCSVFIVPRGFVAQFPWSSLLPSSRLI